jgi:hypothetical protein
MGYAFAFFNTATDEWQRTILRLPELYPLFRNAPDMENIHRIGLLEHYLRPVTKSTS